MDFGAPVSRTKLISKPGLPFELGIKLRENFGVFVPPSEAAALYRKASKDPNDAKAKYNLGSLFLNGNGVKKDDKRALFWFTEASKQGLAAAQYNLGVLHLQGRSGLPASSLNAAIWFRRAALQGFPDAQYNLGLILEFGDAEMKQNVPVAAQWYHLAANSGHALAAVRLEAIEQKKKNIGSAKTCSNPDKSERRPNSNPEAECVQKIVKRWGREDPPELSLSPDTTQRWARALREPHDAQLRLVVHPADGGDSS